jgi:hypothetical protein
VAWIGSWSRCACAVALGVLASGAGCAAMYPEVETPVRDVPQGLELDPPPPDDLLFLRVAKADIPKRTLDGREWEEVGAKAPDPFVIVFAGDRELFRTEAKPNTLHPVWEEEPKVNYRIPPRTQLRLELWDRNATHRRPICQANINDVHDDVFSGGRSVACPSGARVRLIVERARAKMGLGMKLEVRPREVLITRVVEESPAARAELRAGHQVVAIQGKAVSEMQEGEAKSLVLANSRTGVTISVLEAGGSTMTVTLKDGPIYPVEGGGLSLR